MIVKVQLPIAVTKGVEPMALIYNQSRAMQATVPITDALRARCNGSNRVFFEATVNGDGDIELGERLGEQNW